MRKAAKLAATGSLPLAARPEATAYQDGPYCIIAHTVKGKGLEFMERDFTWHGRAVPEKQLQKALEELS